MQDRLKMLIEANLSLARIESLDDLLSQLMTLGKNITTAEAASIMLYNPEKNVLEFESLHDEIIGPQAENILKKTVELRLGEGIAGWVAEKRESIIIKDALQEKRHDKKADKRTGFSTRNLMAAPILYQDELLGVIEALNCKNKSSFDEEDLEILESFANLAAVAIIRSRLMELRLAQQKIQLQMDTAAQIQSLFLPGPVSVEKQKNIWAISEPADFVGGDVYDVLGMPDGSIFFYVGDVSDKGLPAALIMAALSSRIKGEVLLHKDMPRLLEAVNSAMHDLLSEEGYFITIVAGRYWPDTGHMHLVNAGHPPPVWIRPSGSVEVSLPKCLPIGICDEVAYLEAELDLLPGESMVLITDGVTESENEEGGFFGKVRMQTCLKTAFPPPRGKGLAERVKAWRGAAGATDDLTILEIWR
jgi:serine phosphatase RsbU (regulator of sigma subunit)